MNFPARSSTGSEQESSIPKVEGSSPSVLTKDQLRALRWIADNNADAAEWLCDGKPIKRQPVAKWNQFKISGPTGSIIINGPDMRAIGKLITHAPTRTSLYGLNAAGRAALASAQRVEGE